MNSSSLKNMPRSRHRLSLLRLETGFSMLEAVVVVGVLLALAVTGFFAYGPIAENAKRAKVKSTASEVHTAVLVASSDGDSNTEPEKVISDWNTSTDKIRVEILKPLTGDTSSNGDFCIQAINLESTYITARAGACSDVAGGSDSDDIDADGIPNSSDPDIDGDGIPNEEDTTPNGEFSGGGEVVNPLLALAEACYGNSDTTRAGAFWMEKTNIPAAATDISVRSQVFNSGARDTYRSGVVDINAANPACTYSNDTVLDNPIQMYSMLQDPRPWQVTDTGEYPDGSGNTSTWQNLVLPADSGTQVKLSYYDPATGKFKQFYTAAAGDGANGTAKLQASYSETVTLSSEGGWISTNRDPLHVALEFTPGTTEYADLYRVMSTYGGSIEFTAAGKTVTVNVGPEANYYTMDPFAQTGGGNVE